MKGKTCSFIYHRNTFILPRDSILEEMKNIMVDLVNKGVTNFTYRCEDEFDFKLAFMLSALKRDYANIRLTCVCSTKLHNNKNHTKSSVEYSFAKGISHKLVIISDEHTDSRMSHLNEYMVDSADYVVVYWDGRHCGDTYNALMYAKDLNKDIIYLHNEL